MNTDSVAEVYDALKTENRIKTLELIEEEKKLSDIADEINMSYSGVHSYLEDFESAHLVKKKDNKRRITEAGELVLEHTDDLGDQLQEIKFRMLANSFDETATEMGFSSPLSEEEIEERLGDSDG